jgi:prepilin signal peptidase PulO-like enzyme (type II secretory pathway)
MMSHALHWFFVLTVLLAVISLGFGHIPAVQMANYIVLTLSIFILGLSLGSFATALIYRLPRGLPFVNDAQGVPVRSICPPCGRTLNSMELIPVISWLLQGGRCKCGKLEIPIRYPLIEIFTLAYTFLLFLSVDFYVYDLPRYSAIPFAITLGYLAMVGQAWTWLILQILAVISAIILTAALFRDFGNFDAFYIIVNISISCFVFLIYYFIICTVPKLPYDPLDRLMIYGFAPSLFIMSIMIHPVFVVAMAVAAGGILMLDTLKVWSKPRFRMALAIVYLVMLIWPAFL